MKRKDYSLNELIHIKHGYAFKGEYFSDEPTDDILLTPGNFSIGGGFKTQKLKYYNGDFPVDYILDENDVIVTMTDLSKEADTLGFSAKVPAWYGKRLLHNQRIGLVKLKTNDFDQNYLYWLMRTFSYQRFVANGATGASVKHTSPTKICQYKFTAPEDKTIQRRIASILSAYDDLIENNLKRIKLLEEKAFIRYKEIVRSQKELCKLPLSQLATVTSSKRIFLSDYVEDGIPFYRSKEIIAKSNFESIEKPLYITEERYTDIKEKFGVPVSGDLLITSVGTIGFVHLVNDDDGDFYFKDGNLIWIKNLNQSNLAYFLFFKFRTPEFKEMLNSVAIGSSQKALTIETVKKIEIEIPSDDSLIEFNHETKTIIKFIYNIQKQNTKLREARDILLPKLMNGQIEV
jgi:type I restriction enzyme S subunit